jgi:hypothetical protein
VLAMLVLGTCIFAIDRRGALAVARDSQHGKEIRFVGPRNTRSRRWTLALHGAVGRVKLDSDPRVSPDETPSS